MESWRPCGTFSAKPLKLFNFEVTKLNKRTTFTEKKFLVKLFARTREIQSDQPYWNIFDDFLEKSGWKSKTISMDISIFFSKKSFFFLQNVPLDTQTAFLASMTLFCRQKLFFCLRIESKVMKGNTFFYQENIQSVPLGKSNAVFTSLPNFSPQKLDNSFCWYYENDEKQCNIFNKNPQRVFWTRRVLLWQPCLPNFFYQKSKLFH